MCIRRSRYPPGTPILFDKRAGFGYITGRKDGEAMSEADREAWLDFMRRSWCTCGHRQTEHGDAPFAQYHGPCCWFRLGRSKGRVGEICACKKFTWVRVDPPEVKNG